MQPKAYAALEGKAVYMQKSTDELAGMLPGGATCDDNGLSRHVVPVSANSCY